MPTIILTRIATGRQGVPLEVPSGADPHAFGRHVIKAARAGAYDTECWDDLEMVPDPTGFDYEINHD